MSYIDDQQRAQKRMRMRRLLKLWIIPSLGILIALIRGVAYWLNR